MKCVFLFVFLFSTLACQHQKPLQQQEVAADHRLNLNVLDLSYADLEEVMNTVLLTVDGEDGGCPVSAHQRLMLSQSLKSQMDDRFSRDGDRFKKMTNRQKIKFFDQNCTKDSTCLVYSSFADYLRAQGFKLSKALDDRLELVSDLAAKSPRKVSRPNWVCGSDFFSRLLQSEIKD